MISPKRLKPKQVAEQWQCSVSQVLALIHAGKLRGFNISTGNRPRYLIDPSEVERFERGQEVAKPVLRRPKKLVITKHLRV